MAVNLYVWPRTKDYWGHVALEITLPGYREYISLWPEDAIDQKNAHKLFKGENHSVISDMLDELDENDTKIADLVERLYFVEQVKITKDRIETLNKNYHTPYLTANSNLNKILKTNYPKAKVIRHRNEQPKLSTTDLNQYNDLKQQNETRYNTMLTEIDEILKKEGATRICLYGDNSKFKLNEKAMLERWQMRQRKGLKYKLYGKNCCSILVDLLRAGGLEDFVTDLPRKEFNVWTPDKVKTLGQNLQKRIGHLNQIDETIDPISPQLQKYHANVVPPISILKLITPTHYPYTKSVLIDSAKTVLSCLISKNKKEVATANYYLSLLNSDKLTEKARLTFLYALLTSKNKEVKALQTEIIKEITKNHDNHDFNIRDWIKNTKIYFRNSFHLNQHTGLKKIFNNAVGGIVLSGNSSFSANRYDLEDIKMFSDKEYLYQKAIEGLKQYLQEKLKEPSWFNFFVSKKPIYGRILNQLQDQKNDQDNKKLILYAILADNKGKMFDSSLTDMQKYIANYCGDVNWLHCIKENFRSDIRKQVNNNKNKLDDINNNIEMLLNNIHRPESITKSTKNP